MMVNHTTGKLSPQICLYTCDEEPPLPSSSSSSSCFFGANAFSSLKDIKTNGYCNCLICFCWCVCTSIIIYNCECEIPLTGSIAIAPLASCDLQWPPQLNWSKNLRFRPTVYEDLAAEICNRFVLRTCWTENWEETGLHTIKLTRAFKNIGLKLSIV